MCCNCDYTLVRDRNAKEYIVHTASASGKNFVFQVMPFKVVYVRLERTR